MSRRDSFRYVLVPRRFPIPLIPFSTSFFPRRTRRTRRLFTTPALSLPPATTTRATRDAAAVKPRRSDASPAPSLPHPPPPPYPFSKADSLMPPPHHTICKHSTRRFVYTPNRALSPPLSTTPMFTDTSAATSTFDFFLPLFPEFPPSPHTHLSSLHPLLDSHPPTPRPAAAVCEADADALLLTSTSSRPRRRSTRPEFRYPADADKLTHPAASSFPRQFRPLTPVIFAPNSTFSLAPAPPSPLSSPRPPSTTLSALRAPTRSKTR
ncbi:hypothetical protein R3P38DRAFT_3216970 [Favolaschia claudopus]|uniref:Uncharacterized protein n=1 Tax=Favolaschia claudopus TaxID=2862362 RepID=A0AAW0A6B9_9AGAR